MIIVVGKKNNNTIKKVLISYFGVNQIFFYTYIELKFQVKWMKYVYISFLSVFLSIAYNIHKRTNVSYYSSVKKT